MDFLIASNNAHKVQEFKRILAPLGINAISAKEAGFDLGEVAEDGKTFRENAFIKAESAFLRTGLPSVADDSGLCVDALDGAPGIFSARYGGEGLSDRERTALLLKNMQDVPESQRTARFICSICCMINHEDVITLEGVCEGSIAFETCGDGGFGYDPVFITSEGKCFGSIPAQEKDEVSHRGVALRSLFEILKDRKDLI
ncbi:MAG: RdgB/HAM1 family non-canonical purine NTP pyrophosphatase [Eubacteriales bacterium]|nr:RdgB/HAM1 family non-canonical purine NTP pyrophosphatase [Eubacteriales bacterium]